MFKVSYPRLQGTELSPGCHCGGQSRSAERPGPEFRFPSTTSSFLGGLGKKGQARPSGWRGCRGPLSAGRGWEDLYGRGGRGRCRRPRRPRGQSQRPGGERGGLRTGSRQIPPGPARRTAGAKGAWGSGHLSTERCLEATCSSQMEARGPPLDPEEWPPLGAAERTGAEHFCS